MDINQEILTAILDPTQWIVAILTAFFVRQYQLGLRINAIFLVQIILAVFMWDQSSPQGLILVLVSVFRTVVLLLLIKPRSQLNADALKVGNIIGTELHRQIINALTKNEQEAGVLLNDLTSTGYMFGFIEKFAKDGGVDATDELFSHVLNGVLPDKLTSNFKRNYERLILAKEVSALGSEVINFNAGVSAGRVDADKLRAGELPINLEHYLSGYKITMN